VGYRVVHGADRFHRATLIDDSVVDQITVLAEYAPLHNPLSVQAIQTGRQILPQARHVAVFDTAENQSLPERAFLYAVPAQWHKKHAVRRFGFHGISQRYVAGRAALELHRPLDQLKVISCHLGNGTSVTAFADGRVVDTSMGLTPMEGPVMATRCGDLDPGAILHVMEKEGLSASQMQTCLNQDSGLLGLCGRRDMREILSLAEVGDQNAQTAIEVYAYRIRKYIGAYAAVLNGVDVLIFTAGIGENSPEIRRRILSDFDYLGVVINDDANENNHTKISDQTSAVTVMVIPTNEELAIAEQTYTLLSKADRIDNAI
jgi:acetate kinase